MNKPVSPLNPDHEPRLNKVIAEYLKRKDAGQEISKDAMLKAYPDLAEGLRSYFAGEALMNDGGFAFAPTKHGPQPVPGDLRETVRPGMLESDTASEFTSKKFGRYQLLRPLGEGAMGSVYLALDTTLDRKVALKVPKTEGSANAEFMTRFTREARAAAALKHPNICSVYDAGQHEGTAYITMDYIDGVPLSRFIGSQKLHALDSILQMITIIAQAVGHAHSKGVIHRDLKPGNILVDADFNPHVTDFGLARRDGPADEARITQEGLLIGTPAYMSPEQVKGEQAKVGAGSDVYALGVIFFELLTSRLPFEGKVAEMFAKVLRDNPPVPSRLRKDLTEDVDDICLKMLKKEPSQRFTSMGDVVVAIELLRKKLSAGRVESDATEQQKSPFEIQKSHVEVMLKQGQYTAAIQELEKLAAEKSPGAKAVGEWARAALPVARAESKALSPAGLSALLQTGQQLFAKSDYLGCIQLLEDVPSLRRTEAMEDLLVKARKREADSEQLLSEIKDKERRQQIDGLEPLVRRFLKLKPGNSYGKRMLDTLRTYSKTPASRRTYLYEKGRLQPMPATSFLQQWAVLGLLVGVLAFLSVTYYVVIYLKSGNQTLAVHVDDEWLKSQGGKLTLVVDGKDHTIAAPSMTGDLFMVTVSLGEHTFSVKQGDTVVHDPKNFQIEKNGRKILSITATDIRLDDSVPLTPSNSGGVASAGSASPMPGPETKPTLLSGPIPGVPMDDAVTLSNSTEEPQLAIAPFNGAQAKQHQEVWAAHLGQAVEIENSIGMKLRLIPPGEFMMGSPPAERDRAEEETQHRVRISKPFYMAAHEVTRAQFEAFVRETGYQTEGEADGVGGGGWDDMGVLAYKPELIWKTPGFPQEANHPVVHVSWNDAQKFAAWLSAREQQTYRLPTEAEWEYACRAGSEAPYSNGSDPEKLVTIGNVADASTLAKFPDWTGAVTSNDGFPYSAPVGSFQPNSFALYDLHGNAWEWCQDLYDAAAYQSRPELTIDPAVENGTERVMRGGAWTAYAYKNRSAFRDSNMPDDRFSSHGFRLVRNCSPSLGSGTGSGSSSSSAMTRDESLRLTNPRGLETDVPDPNASLKNISQVHGATAEELVVWAKGLPAVGYRPYWISVRGNPESILYDALAAKTADQSEWVMQFYDHGDQTNWAEMKQQYRPALLNVYVKDDINERLVMWVKGSQEYEYWFGRQDFMEEKLIEGLKWDQGEKDNRERWLPTSVVGHWFDGAPSYHMLMAWLPYHQCEWKLDIPLADLSDLIEKYRARGWQPANLNIIHGSNPARCSAVFGDNPENRKWSFSPKLSVSEYRSLLIKVDELGGMPQCVFSRVEDDQVIYSVLWHGVEL